MMKNRQRISDVESNKFYEITAENEGMGLALHVPGYGTNDMEPSAGPVVLLEMRDGVPFLLVWADITTEEPTHKISLAGASEKLRKN